MNERFWRERSVPGSPDWPFFRGRFLSRYRFAYQFCQGKRTLDVAAGVGYGSHLLATEGGASEVVGLDISEETVSYARAHYATPKISFVVGNCQELSNMRLGTFDVVVSMGIFELISEADAFAGGVRSLLQKQGVWLVTMLNPLVHDSVDPFHYQEFRAEEFHDFLCQHFREVTILGHQFCETGKAKQQKNAGRFARVPDFLKRSVKQIVGPALSWRVSLLATDAWTPDDYTWTSDGLAEALEFMGLARVPR